MKLSLITRLCPVARPVRPRCAVPPKAAARPEHRRQMTIFRATICESRKRGAEKSNTTGCQPMTSASGAQRKT